MLKYEKKEWYDKDDPRKIPINHTNLNRIEEGIAAAVEAINEIKPSYYFSEMSSHTKNAWTTVFQMPKTIDFSKYIALVWQSEKAVYTSMIFVPIDGTAVSIYDAYDSSLTKCTIEIKISQEGIVSYKSSFGDPARINIMLVPISKPEMEELT